KRKVDSEFQIYQPDGEVLQCIYEHDDKWYTKIKDEINHFYWNRYRKYLLQKGWPINIVHKLEFDTLDRIMNLLGNVRKADPFNRRGLVMGDVQSGKTSNYIGLINKAADA